MNRTLTDELTRRGEMEEEKVYRLQKDEVFHRYSRINELNHCKSIMLVSE